jgi:hypothetical protein
MDPFVCLVFLIQHVNPLKNSGTTRPVQPRLILNVEFFPYAEYPFVLIVCLTHEICSLQSSSLRVT